MLLARALSIISPFFISLVMGLLVFSPAKFYYPIILSVCLTLATIWLLIKLSHQVKQPRVVFFYILQGLLYLLGAILFLLFLESLWFKLGLVVLTFLVLLFYYNQLFSQLYKQSVLKTEPQFFTFNFLEILAVFFFASSFFGLRDFLNWPLVWLILALFCLIFIIDLFNRLVVYQPERLVFLDSLIASLVLTEIFWGILGLALVYYLKGVIFSLIYLVFTVSSYIYYKKVQPANIFKVYLIIALIIAGVILLTARWF